MLDYLGLQPNNWYHYKTEEDPEAQRRPCEDGGMCLKVKELKDFQGSPEAGKRQGRILPWSHQKEDGPADTLISAL